MLQCSQQSVLQSGLMVNKANCTIIYLRRSGAFRSGVFFISVGAHETAPEIQVRFWAHQFKKDVEGEVQADGERAWAYDLPGEGGGAGSLSSGEEDTREVI